jgi:enoyl-CoA hydratase/carnithine racemase
MIVDSDIGVGAAGSQYVKLRRESSCSVVVLDRPAVRNALSGAMLHELVAALAEADRDPGTSAIVLTGAGSAFCSGDDLREAAHLDVEVFDDNIALLQRASEILLASSKPSVAALNGATIGGGLELTLACDIRIAAEHAIFGCPEVRWGLVCTNGASVLLPAVVGHGRAREMLLTGKTYDAAWALAAGLISEVTPSDQVRMRATALAADIAQNAHAVRLTRELLGDASQHAIAKALARESDAVAAARRTDAAATNLDNFRNRRGSGRSS